MAREVTAGRSPLERLSSEIGNRGFAQVVARSPLGPTSPARPIAAGAPVAEAAATRALARAAARRREGDARNEAELEELEGLGRTPPRRRLQRLAISQVSLTSGTCGQREVKWIFRLDNPAAEPGYIVQHVQGSQDIANCPGPRSGTMTSSMDFWEAWPIAQGATVHPRTTQLGQDGHQPARFLPRYDRSAGDGRRGQVLQPPRDR